MGKGVNREQIIFFVGAALFLWVMVKLGLYLTRPHDPPTEARVAVTAIRQGDPKIGEFIASPGLASYLGRGSRDSFFPDVSQPAEFYVRAAISHAFRKPLPNLWPDAPRCYNYCLCRFRNSMQPASHIRATNSSTGDLCPGSTMKASIRPDSTGVTFKPTSNATSGK